MTLFSSPRQVALDSVGTTLPGALLYFYEAGTSTPLDTFSDVELVTAHANPVVADSGGVFPTIHMSAAYYKVILKDASDVLQWTEDDYSGVIVSDRSITFAKMATGTAGALISYAETTGVPAAVLTVAGDVWLGGNGEGKPPSMKPFPSDVAREWTKTQNFNATELTDEASIAWDLEINQVTSVILTDNRTLSAPTNMVDGATYILTVIQDATGSRTLAFDTTYKFPEGEIPILTTAADAVDILTFISDGTVMRGAIAQDFK